MKEADRAVVREMIRDSLDEIERRHAGRIEEIVNRTIEATLQKIGVDANDYKGEQADRIWTRNNRLASQKLHSVGYAAAVTIAITSLFAVIWTGLLDTILKGLSGK